MQFRQVFFGLLALSLLSAFALPVRVTQLSGAGAQTLLVPISRPSFQIANAVRAHFASRPADQIDTRETRQIVQENLALKQQIQQMSNQMAQLEERANERASLGGFQAWCDRFELAAADAELRDAITITGSGIGKVAVNDPVLSSGSLISLIGRVTRAGEFSAQVKLITDAGFAVTGHFVSYSTAGAQEHKDLTAIVTGHGGGALAIQNLPLEEVRAAGIQPGDWVVLSDETWPAKLQGVRIARIDSIEPLARQTLFADIRLAPEPYLEHLPDVWVMTRGGG